MINTPFLHHLRDWQNIGSDPPNSNVAVSPMSNVDLTQQRKENVDSLVSEKTSNFHKSVCLLKFAKKK